jgi:uncharacterized protein (DUF1015 family)
VADIVPFAGLRYDPVRVGDLSRVLAPPYDVIDEAERAVLEARDPRNVVRIELPRGEGDARYAEAARLLAAWSAEGVLRIDAAPAFYIYDQTFDWGGWRHSRRGFFAAVRIEPFERRVILPHEKTLREPQEDRARLMRATRTQVSPVFGLFRDADGAAQERIDAATIVPPAIDTRTADGVRHRLWPLTAAAAVADLGRILAGQQILIADGHHRYETMLRLGPELRALDFAAGAASADFALMFLARAEDPGLLVLPTHRLLRDLPELDFAALRAAAAPAFEIVDGEETTAEAIDERLTREGAGRVVFAVRVHGQAATTWFKLKPIVDLSALGPPALRRLDVTVLHGVLLGSLLGIDDAALEGQAFLAYTHLTAEAIRRVAAGEAQAAFLMNATKLEQVWAASEAGVVLPQKSTYFHPKPATGLLMYPLDGPAPG